jgi:CRISPR type III-B/RAMP module-associated protein Cmr5
MTLEQTRAAMAYGHLEKVTTKDDRTLYGSMAQKLPALIRAAGLCQAIHFVKSRQKPVLENLLSHLADQLKRIDTEIKGVESLCTRVREADLAHYVWLTREALAAVSWYGRLARSEWGVLPGDGDTNR